MVSIFDAVSGKICQKDVRKKILNRLLKEGYPGDEYVDVISTDIYLPEYSATNYHEDYEKLIA